MRSPSLAVVLLFFLFALNNGQLAEAGKGPLLPRQNQPAPQHPAPAPAAAASSLPAPAQTSAAAAAVTASPSPPQSDAASSSQLPSASPSPSPAHVNGSANITNSSVVSTSTSSFLPSSTSFANMTTLNATLNGTIFPIDELPLPPDVTPALSVAGVLLMLSGIIYCLIGIKNKWIQIFTSTAYLVSLSILVLIVYIINPPITLAVQGAYLVACVAPGLMIGGISLVFRDVTEGLGCAVGGFAMAMFFLVLKPGGLIVGEAGKAIFIGCWTVGIFAFSFSHYTRHYALIGSTALGGSTALVLGIDCFSKAGLKEFWVYIWGLNDNLFPLLTESYPLTRGIRVEIAGIVVFTFVGVMSQLKIWKVIQARRAQRKLDELEANRERDEIEADIGKKVESGNDQQRGQWEAIYGERSTSHDDSGVGTDVGSTRKGSFNEKSESFEMDKISSHVIRVAEDEIVPSPMSDTETTLRSASGPLSESGFSEQRVLSIQETILPTKPKAAVTAAPKVTPLPFKAIVSEESKDDDVASNATFADSERSVRRYSQRFSGSHLKRKLSKKSNRLSMQTSSSVEALVDQSALGDSLDGDRSIRSLSSAEEPDHANPSEIKRFSWDEARDTEAVAAADGAEAKPENDGEEKPSTDDDVVDKTGGTVRSPSSVKSRVSTKSHVSVANLKEHLPQDAPRVVLQYRTNEWAKHLSNAEQPGLDELPQIAAVVEEAPTAVNARALLQTPLTAEPKPMPIAASHPSPPNSMKSMSPTASIKTISPPGSPPTVSGHGFASRPNLQATSSMTSIAESINSARSANPMTVEPSRSTRRLNSNIRSSSSPLLTSAIQEDEEASFVSPLPSDTLLAQRGTHLQQKALTGSTSRLSSSHSNSHPYQFSRSQSTLSVASNSSTSLGPKLQEDDHISLAIRKSILQQQGGGSSSSSSSNNNSPNNSSTTLNASSPDPLRRTSTSTTDPTLRRASMLAAWRASIAEDVERSRGPEAEVSARRSEMWEERQRERERAEMVRRSQGGWNKDPGPAASRNSRRMSGMSGREMDGAHREVLRRMQAGANKTLRESGAM